MRIAICGYVYVGPGALDSAEGFALQCFSFVKQQTCMNTLRLNSITQRSTMYKYQGEKSTWFSSESENYGSIIQTIQVVSSQEISHPSWMSLE